MRALTVRQPWAGAIIHHGKSPENRTRNIAGSYRGPLAIHVGLRHDYATVDRYLEIADGLDQHTTYGYGAIIGVVDLIDVHEAFPDADDGTFQGPCCLSPWAEYDAGAHLMLANPRPLATPIPARGMLGLWTPPPAVLEQLQAVV